MPVAAGVGIYLLGTHHTPNYDNGLFGEHGAAAVDLKARPSTALLGLTLIQPGLALWMYGRVPGARSAAGAVGEHRLPGVRRFRWSGGCRPRSGGGCGRAVRAKFTAARPLGEKSARLPPTRSVSGLGRRRVVWW
ncbi:DUF6529 family protein [Streptomyces sp. NPDC051064]|uniref:DUF6529 family protein n=1 Tax=Streptomyces sp. NPDC051064 TaxID=3365641 RepID=UPI00378E3E1F